MSSAGHPSTLIALARQLISVDTPWQEAADHIEREASGDRQSLQTAVLRWVGVMRRGPSDDFAATNVLRALERVLASTPRHHQAS